MTGLLSRLGDGRLLRILSYGAERAVDGSTGWALWGERPGGPARVTGFVDARIFGAIDVVSRFRFRSIP